MSSQRLKAGDIVTINTEGVVDEGRGDGWILIKADGFYHWFKESSLTKRPVPFKNGDVVITSTSMLMQRIEGCWYYPGDDKPYTDQEIRHWCESDIVRLVDVTYE